ncbi:tyrosine-protein phosphatase non-receptor type 23-like isoform X2 [Dermatophagoides pteronyssinus]|uniref:tyrosine-protein phosphatase non-receptor type 23-like isoform X2 n=1 Tax=Dermatophagoides pteronyssinus TaxID=6956 RepID=UPI003F668C3C
MEAVPRLPMLSFEMKISPVCPDFAMPFKRFISKYYGEDGDIYDREILELENLRNNACRAPRDVTGCSIMKRYYCQISSLFNRFGSFENNNIGVQCVWADIYSGQTTIGDLDFELACILYNIGALHADLGAAADGRQTQEEMKIACTHFQCAAWAFQHLIEDRKLFRTSDISNDVLQFFVQIMLAQAQECILEKSMLDNRKALTVAKITAQVVDYYRCAMTMLQQGAMNTSSTQSSIIEIVGGKLFKSWKKFVEFKLSYYDSICSLYMGNATEDQQQMGERIAWYELALEKIQSATTLAKQLDDNHGSSSSSSVINEAISFVTDVITIKLQNGKKENDFIYHAKVPPIAGLPEIKGVSLVKGIPFNVCDPEVSGPDIFARLVPIQAHELASIYSAKKDEILRNIREKIEEKNQELMSFMSSLLLDKEHLRAPKEDSIPDELINICAELSLHPESVEEVAKILTQLDTVSHDTGKIIEESRELLKEEEEKEQKHQEKFGKRPPSMIVVELSKELAKHEETHKKAIESNKSLWDNFDQHKDDILIMMSSSASKIASILPSNKNIKIDESIVTEMERLFDKIDEMKTQRSTLEDQLTKQMNDDNVLKLVLAHPRDEIERIFDDEIKKYDKIVNLLEQNLTAQSNILRAMTNCNAGYADTRKEILEIQRNRKTRIASLLYTYQVFRELQVNSKKGLEFYRKFQSIVVRLNARIRGVSKVQDEERQQFIQAQASRLMMAKGVPPSSSSTSVGMISTPPLPPSSYDYGSSNNIGTGMSGMSIPTMIPATGAKLKDYLPFMKANAANRSNLMSKPSLPSQSTVITGNSSGMIVPPVSSSFAPSAPSPSLTPTPPIMQSMTNFAPNMMMPPVQSTVGQTFGSMVGQQSQSHHQQQQQPIAPHYNSHSNSDLQVTPGNMIAMSQYSPPPSYSKAISSHLPYGSLPVINNKNSSIIPFNIQQPQQQQYPNNIAVGNTGESVNTTFNQHQPISSILPINNPQQLQHYPLPSSSSSSTSTLSNSSMIPSSATYNNYQYNNSNTASSVATNIPNSNVINAPMAGYNNNNYSHSSISNPIGQSNSNVTSYTNYPTKPIQGTNVVYHPTQANIMTNNNNTIGQQQQYSNQQYVHQPPSLPSSQQPPYPVAPSPMMPSYLGTSNTTTTTNVPKNIPNPIHSSQQQQQQPGYPISGYHGMPQPPSQSSYPQTTMINGYHQHQPQQQQQQLQPATDPATNITAILEQESKRGWQVLTPVPAATPVIKNENDVNNVTKNNDNIKSSSSSSSSSDCLPDILSTMSLNGNGGQQQQQSQPSTLIKSEISTTATNGQTTNSMIAMQ